MVNPPAGLPRDRQQPHRRRRLPAPHHLRVDDRLPGAADRGDAGRARAPLASPTSSACSTTSSRCPGIETVHRLSRLHPSRQRETRAIERLKSWDGVLSPDSVAATIVHAFTVVFAQAIVRAAVPDPELRGALAEPVRRCRLFEIVSSPWRFQERLLELWDEGDPTWFASPEQPGGTRAGTRSRWRRSSRRSTGSRSASAATRTGGAGGACTASSSCTRSARRTRSSGASSTARVEAGGASETVTQNGYLRDRRRSRRSGGPCTGWWPTSATRRARAGS